MNLIFANLQKRNIYQSKLIERMSYIAYKLGFYIYILFHTEPEMPRAAITALLHQYKHITSQQPIIHTRVYCIY